MPSASRQQPIITASVKSEQKVRRIAWIHFLAEPPDFRTKQSAEKIKIRNKISAKLCGIFSQNRGAAPSSSKRRILDH
jgi:hypothetical protein